MYPRETWNVSRCRPILGARCSWQHLCYGLVWVGVTLGHSCLQAFCFAIMGWPWAPLTVLWALGAMGATALRIGAFNIQSFGDHKVSDPDCGSVIAQILAGYDIVLVQEVRDPDLSAVSLLMEQINRCGRAGHRNPSRCHKLGLVP